MQVLLIAYEYPPIESAQALRWHYLGRELVAAGVDLTILAPALLPESAGGEGPGTVIRTWPGPFVGASAWLARRGRAPVGARATGGRGSRAIRTYELIRAVLNQVVFPDVRSEWYPFARRALRRLGGRGFDAVIASHEPGVDLMLGMNAARRLDRPLILDLGDPLVTPYTPRWRAPLDRRLERRACLAASGVITTTAHLGAELANRYRLDPAKLTVIAQGFDATAGGEHDDDPRLPANGFWLFFSGNFYRDFRNPENFLRALAATHGVHLVYAGHTPDWLLRLIEPLADRVTFLGRLPHRRVLAIQRRAPMLLSIGNLNANQLPGKLYEYFGAHRPILHLGTAQDEACPMLEETGRGRCVEDDGERIAAALAELEQAWRRGSLNDRYRLDPAAVAEHSWQQRGADLATFLRERVGR